MRKKMYDEASIEFEMAQYLHKGKLSFILPYLAEINFLTGRYSEVSKLLNSQDSLELNSTLNPIIEQWRINK
jgi:hypothetical protein